MLWTIPNIFGASIVGKGLVFLGVIVMMPFIAVAVIGFTQGSIGNLAIYSSTSVMVETEWFSLFSLLYFSYGAFDCISAVAGEVNQPGKIFPRALMIGALLVTSAYVIPLTAAAMMNRPNVLSWVDGEWSNIAENMVCI